MELYLLTPGCIHGMGKDNYTFYKDNDCVSRKAVECEGSFSLGKASRM